MHGDHGPIRLAELTRAARALLLDSTGAYARGTALWRDRVDVVTGPLQGTIATALLMRPTASSPGLLGTPARCVLRSPTTSTFPMTRNAVHQQWP
ncbi:aromatic-ring hydroxylase C-terminal domain-containing protein [Nocardia sp. CY41]|uniref:aromatic-ring hydroxylase C-terminal domain-containing protein n=1 Tax=Nocardia sp. CY41 TaxID=2608686 RepID=UPI002E286972|nr:hypothetical protein [Nocardia sp. CY41]